jgi:hypothetical protein
MVVLFLDMQILCQNEKIKFVTNAVESREFSEEKA